MRVLHIEDDAGEAMLLREALKSGPDPVRVEPVRVETLADGLAALRKGKFDVVLTDLGLVDSQGLATYRAVRAAFPDVPTVVLSGLDDESVALQALREGAHDYLVKGRYREEDVTRVLRNSIARAGIQRQLREERKRQKRPDRPGKVRLVHVQPEEHQGALSAHVKRIEAQGCLVVLATFERSHAALREQLHRDGVPTSGILFVDATGSSDVAAPSGVLIGGSTSRLDAVALRVEEACGRLGVQSQVVIDSLNLILRQTDTSQTLRFMQFVGNRMRALGVPLDFIVADDAPGRGLSAAVHGVVDTVTSSSPGPKSVRPAGR
jgi:DNA-binding NarL/FixJ family response regulator